MLSFASHAKKNLSCSDMGIGDLKQHVEGKSQKSMAETLAKNRKIDFKKKSSSISDTQIRAEVLHTNFIVQHNISFLT